MIPITVLPEDKYEFDAITPGQIREMNIGAWTSQGLTLEEAEEFEDITDNRNVEFGSELYKRYDKLTSKMAEFNAKEREQEEEKKKDNFIYKILSSFWK